MTLLPLLGMLVSAPAWSQQAVHDSVVVLFDTSGSMDKNMGSGQTRMETAKPALKTVLTKLPPDTWVGLLTFRGWEYELGPRDDQRLFEAIDRLSSDGSTPLGNYLKIAADRLLQEREAEHGYGTSRLIVVTDGQANDEDVMEQNAPEVVARRIRMDVIGLAMQDEHTLARTANSYQPASSAAQLDEALRRVIVEGGASDGGEPDYDFIAAIPDDVAALWLDAATSPPPNYPIGEVPSAEGDATAPETPAPAASTDATCSVVGTGGISLSTVALAALLGKRRRGK